METYIKARKDKGLSREQAVDAMAKAISTDRLQRLENGKVALQPQDVLVMSKAYNMPELRNHYCTNKCPIGKEYTPQIEMCTNIYELLVNITLFIETAYNDRFKLLEKFAQGKTPAFDDNEFYEIQENLDKLSACIEALQIWYEKSE